jgi:hypothetical protein
MIPSEPSLDQLGIDLSEVQIRMIHAVQEIEREVRAFVVEHEGIKPGVPLRARAEFTKRTTGKRREMLFELLETPYVQYDEATGEKEPDLQRVRMAASGCMVVWDVEANEGEGSFRAIPLDGSVMFTTESGEVLHEVSGLPV